MKKRLMFSVKILSVAVLSGTLVFQNVYGQASTPFLELSTQAIYGTGEELDHILRRDVFSLLQNLLRSLDTDVNAFLNNKENIIALSEVLNKLILPICTYTVKTVGFYYGPTNCTYYHYEKKENFPDAQIANKFVEITTLVSRLIRPKRTQDIHLEFAKKFNETLAYHEGEGDCPGLINKLITYYKKISKDLPTKIVEALQQIDYYPDQFFNDYKNIEMLDINLWTLISAIDVSQKDANGNVTFFDQNKRNYMNQKDPAPNARLAGNLIEIANSIDTLVKNRRLGISVFDTYAELINARKIFYITH